MLFNSIEFLVFFLPIALIVFLLLQRTGRTKLIFLWLTACSIFFYAWWNPVYVLLIAFSVVVNYATGCSLAVNRGSRALLAGGLLFNLGLLAYFKYAGFLLSGVNDALDLGFNFQNIILPLAISFYTFQQITYLVDISKGKVEAHSFIDYCLFVTFFPQLIAGPIVHHSEMLAQFRGLAVPGNTRKNLVVGFSILFIGLFKKVVIADSFALFASPVFSAAASGQYLLSMDVLVGVFSYAFQLYFDFSGYSDMAIGLACLFGIKLPVNFFSPYRAQNISDFWRMWHATLSRFLRDYVYAPLGGYFCSPGRQRVNLFSTMFFGGVWHGAGWTFVVYGVLHGVYVVVHQLWRIKVSGPLGLVGNRYYQYLAQIFTFLVVALTLIFFRADSVGTALHVFESMSHWGESLFSDAYLNIVKASNLIYMAGIILPGLAVEGVLSGVLILALSVCWLLPNTYQLFSQCDVMLDDFKAGRPPVLKFHWSPNARWGLAMAIMALVSLMNLTQVSEFLYFQF